ncbi:HTTM domain-containing protein [Adhaeribacter aquaticus]|uniref:HTTM domain-containing protein n=1 Tax=Adhaeribacter aquaticus TaxID=299567 RepID=UPI00041F9420|nr:HTTM domain-containing protein [Adhaeribacter aquaticus]
MTVTNSNRRENGLPGWWDWLQRPIHIAPLITFRILFGGMMLASIIRFWLNGWITELYVEPSFYFTYLGFEWVHPLGYTGMHLLFTIMAISSLLILLGLFYRPAAVLFFLTFTYVELIDSTNYLNHYYFVSLISFLLIWLPANRYWALDVVFFPRIRREQVPLWTVGLIRLQLGMVYFFAGIAKLHPDWLLNAMPLRIWLPAKTHLPLIGPFLYEPWVAYFFSWFGAIYDLGIAFFLINRKTRPVAYFFVLAFHLATAVFFPGIGMFPYIMIVSSFIFFSSNFHAGIFKSLEPIFSPFITEANFKVYSLRPITQKFFLTVFSLYFILQVIIPFRYLLYPGHLFWNEEGFRFSWRVMLMEKSGIAYFYIKEPATGKTYEINNREFLTPLQEKMMSTQPDMMIRYAHHLAAVYAGRGLKEPAVYAESYVSLNGERSRLYLDSTVNLAKQVVGWKHYTWVLPYIKTEQ